MKTKDQKIYECEHNFQISQIIMEPAYGMGMITSTLMMRFAYVVCTKCGEVRKNNI